MLWFKRCKHENVRCIHGDEIATTGRAWPRNEIARVWCLDCDKPVYRRDIPFICTVTGDTHPFAYKDRW